VRGEFCKRRLEEIIEYETGAKSFKRRLSDSFLKEKCLRKQLRSLAVPAIEITETAFANLNLKRNLFSNRDR
jgi:hypothetical protein